MYHRIAHTERDPWKLAVSPDRFAAQIAVLKEQRQVLPLRTFVQLYLEHRLTADAVAITFDDGYACNAVVAAPLLRRFGLPATFFLVTGQMGSLREFWWDELERLICDAPAMKLVAEVGGAEFRIDLAEPKPAQKDFDALEHPSTERELAHLRLWRALRECGAEEQTAVLDRMWRQVLGHVPAARPSHRSMTRDEARALAQSELAEIGAHTVTHPPLGRLDAARQAFEVVKSKEECDALAGSPVRSFAYPYGDLGERSVEVVREAGFEIACTTEEGSVTERASVLALPRLAVRNWEAPAFRLALNRADQTC